MEKNRGLAIHCRHDKLIDYCSSFQKRQEEIRKNKPENEHEIRLRLFRLLPAEVIADLPIDLQKASAEWERADIEWEKANAKWHRVNAELDEAYAQRNKAYAKWSKAEDERKEASAEWDKAEVKWKNAYAKWESAYAKWGKAEADIWHAKWCGCSEWVNGQIIFK